MGTFGRVLANIGEFFSRDILSFAILIFLSVFLLNHLASAQTVRKASSIARKSWQINLGFNTAQKTQSTFGLMSETSIRFAEDSSFKGLLNYMQYSKNARQNDISDALMNFYFMKSQWSSGLTLSPYITSTLPLSKDSTQRQFLNFGAGLGVKLSGQSRLGSGILSTSGSVSTQKYFHKYEVAANNYSNISYISNQQITTGWDYKKFGFAIQLRHVNSWNYSGTARDSFFHMQTLSWNVNHRFAISAGQTSYGTVILPNQEEIENRLIDDHSSAFFVSANYIF